MNKILGLISVTYIFFLSTLMFVPLSAAAVSELETFDIRSYHPENQGLRDIKFEVRVDQLLEKLNSESVFGKLSDVYFEVFWLFPDKLDIEVVGLPKGFKERKEALKGLIANRLDFVIPQKLAQFTNGYTLTAQKKDQKILLEATDKTGLRSINRMEFLFDKESKLLEFSTYSNSGTSASQLTFQAYPWSQNKWAIEKSKVENVSMGKKTIINTEIKYTTVAGFGLPQEVGITTQIPVITGTKEKEISIEEIKNAVKFSNYQVNLGKAAEHFKTPANSGK